MITDLELASPLQKALFLRAVAAQDGIRFAPGEIAAIASLARVRRFRKGEVLIERGAPPEATYRVVEGKVGMRFRGRKVELATAGDTVGFLATLARVTDAHAYALEDTLTLEIDADAWTEVFEDQFGMIERSLRIIARGLVEHFSRDPGVVFGRDAEPGPAETLPLDLVRRMLALRRWGVFNSSGLDALADFCRGLREVEFEPGDVIWRAGDGPADCSLIIVHGIVEVVSRGRIYRVGHDWSIGAMDTLADMPRWHDAIAETRVVGLWSDREYVVDLLEDNVELGMDMLAQLAGRLLDAQASVTQDLWVSMEASMSGFERPTLPRPDDTQPH